MPCSKCRKNGHNKRTCKSKGFLYNPDNPKTSYDVYIDKNPKDTINIKYTTIKDVKDTIKDLEHRYQTKTNDHKRVWQVAMIMKVRLGVIVKNYKKKHEHYKIALNYYNFLKQRTKIKTEKDRRKFKFSLRKVYN